MPLSPRRVAAIARSGLARQVFEQAGATAVIQLLGAITTLSFIHLLPKHEYGMFALCLSTVSSIAVASDLGLMASMTYFWRRHIATGEDFSEWYVAMRRVRLILFAIFGSLGSVILTVLAGRQGIGGGELALCIGLTLVLSWSQILSAMTVLSLRLTKQLRPAYLIELAAAIVRAGLAVIGFVFALRQAWYALAGLGAASLVMLALARSRVGADFRSARAPTRASMRAIVQYIVPTVPATLLFAVQDSFVYWLAAGFGGTTVVAQTFALGRLAAIFVTLNSIMANVIIPRIVNIADREHARRNGLVSVAIIAAFCTVLTGLAAIWPEPLLLVLGKPYAALHWPLVIALASGGLMLVGQSLGQLNRTMGWVRWETANMVFHAILIVVTVPFFDFRTTMGALSFGLMLAIVGLLEMIVIHLLGERGHVGGARLDASA